MNGLIKITLAAGLVLTALGSGGVPTPLAGDATGPGFKSINGKQIEEHIRFLAAPGLEGRDTPSEGQTRAARYLVDLYREHGLEPARDSELVMKENGADGPDASEGGKSFYRPFKRELTVPDRRGCSLTVKIGGDEQEFEFEKDFVPIQRANGEAEGALVFGGFGIDSSKEKYNDYKSLKVRGRIVLLFEGEPRHKKKFNGKEITEASSLFGKLATLNKSGAAGALVVRRDPGKDDEDPENLLDFRYTYAAFQGQMGKRWPRQPSTSLPTLVISMDCATKLLGQDARKLAASMDKAGRPKKLKLKGVKVTMATATMRESIRHDNVFGILRGTDPELASEYVLLGAHYDHIGVDEGGRIGCGANDNASGCAALLEIMEAMAQSPPRRSVMFASFCGEEDGLVGARELLKDLPMPLEDIVCMVNLDQIGFGDAKEVTVLGVKRNPKLGDVLERAYRQKNTGLKSVVTGKGEELWSRSDHYPFHQAGLPVLFFFEGLPISRNKDYHTWRDTVDNVNYPKVTNTARMVYNTLWILANDDKRPPKPQD